MVAAESSSAGTLKAVISRRAPRPPRRAATSTRPSLRARPTMSLTVACSFRPCPGLWPVWAQWVGKPPTSASRASPPASARFRPASARFRPASARFQPGVCPVPPWRLPGSARRLPGSALASARFRLASARFQPGVCPVPALRLPDSSPGVCPVPPWRLPDSALASARFRPASARFQPASARFRPASARFRPASSRSARRLSGSALTLDDCGEDAARWRRAARPCLDPEDLGARLWSAAPERRRDLRRTGPGPARHDEVHLRRGEAQRPQDDGTRGVHVRHPRPEDREVLGQARGIGTSVEELAGHAPHLEQLVHAIEVPIL